jgi:tetratricopeptide (TPR) repeat protein
MASGTRAQDRAPDVPPAEIAAPVPEERPELEPAVAEHIRSLEESTAALVREGASDDRVALAYGLLGQVYHAYSLAGSAETSYLTAHRMAPADFRWPYLLARLLQRENRVDEALSYYDRARALRADYAPLTVNLGNLHLGQNRIEEAKAAFEAALAIAPSIAAARYGLGQVALSQRDYARAVEHFSWVLTQVPDANRVHYALAMAYRGLGQIEQAQSHLGQQGPVGVRVADPIVDGLSDLIEGARLSLLQGRLAFAAGRYLEATEAFRAAVTAEPDSVPARVNLGSSLGQLKDVDGAIEQFREALELDPSNRAALYNIGSLYAGQNRHDRAVLHLTRLLELTPDDHEARTTLGRELRRAGRLEDALAAFATVTSADPSDEDAVLAQVDVLAALGRHREALETVEQSYALFPTKGRTVARLAYLLATSPQPDLRDEARALELSRQVYQVTGAVGHGAVIAMALAGLDRCEEAIQWQREMIAKAEQQDQGLVAPLSADLKRYETSCR